MKIKRCFWLQAFFLIILFNRCYGEGRSSFDLPNLNYENLLPYKENHLYGVLDVKNNKWVVPPKYKALQFIDDKRLALVDVGGGRFSIITMNNETVVTLSYNFWDAIKVDTSIFIAREAGAGTSGSDISYVIKIEENTIAVEKVMDMFISAVLKNENGLIYIGRNTETNKSLIYSQSAKKVINDSYVDLKKVSNYLISGSQEQQCFLLNYKGEKIMELENNKLKESVDELIEVRSPQAQGGSVGLIKITGEKLITPVYKHISKVVQQVYKCKDKEGKLFMFNARKSEFIAVQELHLNKDKTCLFLKSPSLMQLLDLNCNLLLDFSTQQGILPMLDNGFDLNQPMIYSSKNEEGKDKYGVFTIKDKKIVTLITPQYDYVCSYSGGYTLAANHLNGSANEPVYEYFILDAKGAVLHNLGQKPWSHPRFHFFAGHFFIDNFDKQYLLDKDGKEIWQDKYSHLELEEHKKYLVGIKGKLLDLHDMKLNKIASVQINEVEAGNFSIICDTLSGALIYSDNRDNYFIDTANQFVSRNLKIEKSFKNFHIVYFFEEESPELGKSYNGIVDNNGRYLLKTTYKSIVYEKELGLILAWKTKGLEVYDLKLNKILDDSKIETYFINKGLKLLYLANEVGTYSFYMDVTGKKLLK